MFRLSLEWKHLLSHQRYGDWEEQHVVWAHWGRVLWGISEKEFHLGVEWTKQGSSSLLGLLPDQPQFGFTSIKQSLIFHLPFIFFLCWYFTGKRLSGAWFCLVHLVLLLIEVLLIIDSSVYICHFTKCWLAPEEPVLNTVSARKRVPIFNSLVQGR